MGSDSLAAWQAGRQTRRPSMDGGIGFHSTRSHGPTQAWGTANGHEGAGSCADGRATGRFDRLVRYVLVGTAPVVLYATC